MPTNTLVIGGSGFIGAHLVPKLLATGRRVTVLGRKRVPLFFLPREATYLTGDFSQLELIRTLVCSHEEIIHLAYATVPNTSFDDPLADLLQNLPSTVQLFSEVAAGGGRLILISSGGTVYGEAIQLPVREEHSTYPISPYGVTKLTLEKYARLFAVTHGLSPYVGQGFISTAIASSLQGRPIRIFGGQGTIRDFIYVSDLADGIASVLERGRLSETYNLGSGVGRSNLDVIEAITPLMHAIGCKVHVQHVPERAFDVRANVLDSTKLREHTGWKPQIEFLDGLVWTRDWLRKLHL
jgi:UDP-glucose 4-epimerase